MRGSQWFLVTEWREGWRPSNKEGYRGHNMAAPLSRGIKVGQSVPWMISNSTFWGPIHWKYIYTHALSYIGRKWVRKGDTEWMWLSIRRLQRVGLRPETGLKQRGNYGGKRTRESNVALKWRETFILFSVFFLTFHAAHLFRFNRILCVMQNYQISGCSLAPHEQFMDLDLIRWREK